MHSTPPDQQHGEHGLYASGVHSLEYRHDKTENKTGLLGLLVTQRGADVTRGKQNLITRDAFLFLGQGGVVSDLGLKCVSGASDVCSSLPNIARARARNITSIVTNMYSAGHWVCVLPGFVEPAFLYTRCCRYCCCYCYYYYCCYCDTPCTVLSLLLLLLLLRLMGSMAIMMYFSFFSAR